MKVRWNSILFLGIGLLLGGVTVCKLDGKFIDDIREEARRNMTNYRLLNKLFIAKQENRNYGTYLKMKYERIAIYGMAYVGERFLRELEIAGVEVQFAIDRQATNIECNIPIYSLEDELPQVDVIVVTPTFYYDDIYENLKKRMECDIISLDDVLSIEVC